MVGGVSVQQPELTLNDFIDLFPDEESCRKHLFNLKWPNGFNCPKCGHTKYYLINSRKLIECANPECRHQTSITAGTIFHKTRTSLRIWFWIIFLVAKDKRGISARALNREFPISYPTAWNMLHKIRKAMGERDSHYNLYGIVEIDEAYFGRSTAGEKRGRGTEKKKVLVSVSVNKHGRPQYAKMEVLSDLKKSTITREIQDTVLPQSIIKTDGFKSYSGLDELDYNHTTFADINTHIADILKSVHTLIGNVKAFITGTYHGLDKKYFQNYLNEYCYRFNRRFWQNQLFGRLLDTCINTRPITNILN